MPGIYCQRCGYSKNEVCSIHTKPAPTKKDTILAKIKRIFKK